MKKILAQVELKRIIHVICVICEALKVEREELLRNGYKGVARGVLMDMLYCYRGMKEREIGGLKGI